jgi:hypothetical protein
MGSSIKALDPSPSIGFNTRRLQYLEYQFVVPFKVLALKWHLETSHFVVIEEQLVGVIPVRAYDIVNRNLRGAHNYAELVDKADLPIIPTGVSLAFAGVDNIDVNLIKVVVGFLPCHCCHHDFSSPHFRYSL